MRFSSIKWINNTPYSIDFNDIYFYIESGAEETEHVFIMHNQLKERFGALSNETFTIIETGFGTGLNFLCAASLWQAISPESAKLHFISIEKFPLHPLDLKKAIALWPQFQILADAFLPQYTNIGDKLNTFHLLNGRIQLDLWVGDIAQTLSEINIMSDAWFLDGFAPAKNAEMWSSQVFEWVAKHSKTNTTFATFTSASNVRKGLSTVGFEVEKQPGYGKKREMLSGKFIGDSV